MARHPNPNNKFTTISIRKSDKRAMRTLANQTKETKNGIVYEKDANIFSRILIYYLNNNPLEVKEYRPTYPASVQDKNLSISQLSSSRGIPT